MIESGSPRKLKKEITLTFTYKEDQPEGSQKGKPRFHFMVPLNDYTCEGLTTSTIDVGLFEILFSNPSSHDDLFLSVSESPGDAQDLRPDDRHHGKNT